MSTNPVGTEGATFTIAGRSFGCVEHVPAWNVMRLADAMGSGDEMRALGTMYRFILRMVREDQREALDEFLGETEIDPSDLEHAIGDTLVEMAGRGKAPAPPTATRPSDSSSGPSSDGPQEVAPFSRVVSFSRGTVDVVENLGGEVSIPTLDDTPL